MNRMHLIVIIGVIILSYSISSAAAEQYQVETVAENLEVPWGIAFAPDGRIFVTERVGNLRVIENGILNPEPIKILDVSGFEGGLLGIVLDPNFILPPSWIDPPAILSNRIISSDS